MQNKHYTIVRILLVLAVMAALLAACQKRTSSTEPGSSSLPTPPEDSLTGMERSAWILGSQGFDPMELHALQGDKTIWMNKDPRGKDAVLTFQFENTREFLNSEVIPADSSWSYVFTQKGTYTYWVIGYGVKGKLVVE